MSRRVDGDVTLSRSWDVLDRIGRRQKMTSMTQQPLRCCVCGRDTFDATDYVAMELTVEHVDTRQFFGAHAECLNGVMAPGFTVEAHLM
ncbi:hypothetical protein [Streptomyces sp. NPDC002889]|uniref:hypothetical protein n=1 Tax=Streptomyces sp. NPDC002889 TaxID=3364669 RepID=UPI003681F4A4